MATNHLSQDERMAHGKAREKEVLALLNSLEVVVEGVRYFDFTPSESQDDIYNKIDAWCISDGGAHSVQIKFRDRGEDLGVAAVRPYHGHADFVRGIDRGHVDWDRDMKGDVDLYVCLVDNASVLVVTTGKRVKRAVTLLLAAFAADHKGFNGTRSWYSDKMRGAVVKLVTDQGSEGYSAGQNKIVIYLAPWLLGNHGAMVKRV